MRDEILILVLLAVVGVGSYFLYKKLKEPPPDEVPPVVPTVPIFEVYLIRWEDEQPFQVMSSHKANIMVEDLAGTGKTFTINFYLNSEKVGTVITKEASIGKVFKMPRYPRTYTFTAKVNSEEFSLGIVEVVGEPAIYGSVLVGVRDTQGNPLVGARVALNAEVGVTDSGGIQHFLNVSPGTYQVAVSISGYESQTKSVTVGILETKAVEFKLVIEGMGVLNYF
ncbi:MAG: carboxypeptidase regulatory-like domain-containing protein, partial [Dehalococcoidia bacterium]